MSSLILLLFIIHYVLKHRFGVFISLYSWHILLEVFNLSGFQFVNSKIQQVSQTFPEATPGYILWIAVILKGTSQVSCTVEQVLLRTSLYLAAFIVLSTTLATC